MLSAPGTPEPQSLLRSTRLRLSLGVRETARRSGLDPSHLIRLETGRTTPTIDTLYRLAVALGMQSLADELQPFVNEPAVVPVAS